MARSLAIGMSKRRFKVSLLIQYVEDDFIKKDILSKYYTDLAPKRIKLALRWPLSLKTTNLHQLKGQDREKFYLHGLWAIPNQVPNPSQLKMEDNNLCGDEKLFDEFLKQYEQQILELWPDLKNPTSLKAAKKFIKWQWNKHGKPEGIPLMTYLHHGLTMMSAIPKNFGIPIGHCMKLSEASECVREVLKGLHVLSEPIGADVLPEIRAIIDRDNISGPFLIEEIRPHFEMISMSKGVIFKVVDIGSNKYYTGKANDGDNLVILPSRR